MICKNCSTVFTEKYSKWSNGEFCSKQCAKSYVGKLDKGTKIVKCITCKKEIEVDKRASDKQCKCDDCRKTRIQKGTGHCKNCNKQIKKFQSFCSYKCQREYQYQQNIKDWLSGKNTGNYIGNNSLSVANFIKKYMFRKHNNKCEKCGWDKINEFSNKSPLTIHHKNNDPYDTNEKNLELLCPNCHSLTNSYGGLNKGKGRKNRKH